MNGPSLFDFAAVGAEAPVLTADAPRQHDIGEKPSLYCAYDGGRDEHERCPKIRHLTYPCTCSCHDRTKPRCYHCGEPTNLVLSDGTERRACCFNVERGCDAAARS